MNTNESTFDFILFVLGLIGVIWLCANVSGCAGAKSNNTYHLPPPDYIGRQTPHTIP